MSRDLRIDTLRGLALVVISWHHLPFAARGWGSDAFGFFSFFEVFVFLSGLVAGMVYSEIARREPRFDLAGKAFRRAAVIYATHLVVLSCVIGMWILWQNDDGLMDMRGGGLLERRGPLLAWFYALVLLYQPGYNNVLPLYVLLVPLIPPAVQAVLRGRSTRLLAASVALWSVSQVDWAFSGWRALESALGHRIGGMPFFAWQLLFVSGIWLGARRALGKGLPRPPGIVQGTAFALWLGLIAVANGWASETPLASWLQANAGRFTLAPVRVVNFALVAWFTACAARRWPRAFEIRWLAFLGQHSLQVFAFSVVAVYPLRLLTPASLPVQVASGLLLIAALAVPAWLHAQTRRSGGRSRPDQPLFLGAPGTIRKILTSDDS